MAFYVGQKVACVSLAPMVSDAGGIVQTDRLDLGAIYTVTAVLYSRGVKGLQVAEAAPDKRAGHLGFLAARFRPVVERKTDISALKALLNTAPQKERV